MKVLVGGGVGGRWRSTVLPTATVRSEGEYRGARGAGTVSAMLVGCFAVGRAAVRIRPREGGVGPETACQIERGKCHVSCGRDRYNADWALSGVGEWRILSAEEFHAMSSGLRRTDWARVVVVSICGKIRMAEALGAIGVDGDGQVKVVDGADCRNDVLGGSVGSGGVDMQWMAGPVDCVNVELGSRFGLRRSTNLPVAAAKTISQARGRTEALKPSMDDGRVPEKVVAAALLGHRWAGQPRGGHLLDRDPLADGRGSCALRRRTGSACPS